MKSVLPFFALVLLFSSCTTAYKSGQTPDDVYFSPARPQDEYVRTENREQEYQFDEQANDDRYLRMKVRNRRTWSDLDYYYSDPYAYNYYNRYNTVNSHYYNTPWSYYSSWNFYYNPYNNYYNNYSPNSYNPYGYNPYGGKVVAISPRPPVYNRPRTFNLNVYNPPQNNYYDPKSSGSRRIQRGDSRRYDYSPNNNKSNNSDNSLRSVFGTSSNSSNNTSTKSSTPSRSTSAPSSTPSRSSNAPTRKF